MGKVPEPYDIASVREEWIGRTTPKSEGRYPVEHDPIRRHCHMVDDVNPLYLDPAYASTTRFGGVIAPSVMADYFAGPGAWPPVNESPSLARAVPTRGDRLINLSQAIEYFAPIRIGDRLSSQARVADVFEKAIRLDPKAVCVVIETDVTNQDGNLVVRTRNMLLTHRTPEEVAGDAGAAAEARTR